MITAAVEEGIANRNQGTEPAGGEGPCGNEREGRAG
jgi:hypothetical protein